MADRKPITQAVVRAAKPREKRYEIRCGRVSGLVLRVSPNGRRTYMANPSRGVWKALGSADTLTLEQARTLAKELMGRVAAGEDVRKQRADTLRGFLDDEYTPRVLAHRATGDATEKRLRNVWKKLLPLSMERITVDRVERIQSNRLSQGTTPQTVNRETTVLKAVLSQAVKWGFLEHHPLERLSPRKERDGKRVRYLGQRDEFEDHVQGERERFLGALEGQPGYLRLSVRVAMHTGLRRGEIFSLRWTDVDLAARRIRVLSGKTGTERYVPVNSELLRHLRAWKDDRPRSISGLVVASPRTGGRLNNFQRSWDALVNTAALEDFRFHDLRHDFASRLVQAGVDLYEVRDLLGHASIAMTERYAHLAPQSRAAAVERLVEV